jgi:hypothetical protein
MNKHIVKGTIYVSGKWNLEYPVCRIEQIYYENDEFEYIFTPYYQIIALLDTSVFQGIPGLNLDLKEKEYIRKNQLPTFIYERTPQKNREDLYELLDEVGLEYLDHLEWLIRSNKTYTGDRLFVRRYIEPKTSGVITRVNYGDQFLFKDYGTISANNYQFIDFLMQIIISGGSLEANNVNIDDGNRLSLYNILLPLYINEFEGRKKKQRIGIERAKKENKYLGRKKIKVSPPLLEEMIEKVRLKELTVEEAMNELGLKSKSTYYRRVREFESKSVERK